MAKSNFRPCLTHPTKAFPFSLTYYLLLITHYLTKVNLFHRIQPQKTFHITIKAVAKLLGISPKIIIRIELWEYVLFVHRRDIGGQFISYRKLKNWQHLLAMKIRNCTKKAKLETLWQAIKKDLKKYSKQYTTAYENSLKIIWIQQLHKLASITGRGESGETKLLAVNS